VDRVDAGHERYDELRALFNTAIDRRPALIARCATPADVTQALALARERGLAVAVRAGGHSVSGLSTNDGGLVIDVRPMKELTVDPAQRKARVGGGVTWGEFDAATQRHGLAVTGGRATSTGVAGFTLGGGDGWLARAFGLACDNLLAVELVTADGREVRASDTENADLFWALHGGGGNFGVATAFEFRLHPLGPVVVAGVAGWPQERAREVTLAYRDFVRDAPDAFGSGLLLMPAPPEDFVPPELAERTVTGIAVVYAGDVDEGMDVVRPLKDLEPAFDLIAPMPYTDMQIMLTDPPGYRHYWSADFHDDFPDEAVDIFVREGLERGTFLTQQVLFSWGGAIARVPEDATPVAHRSTQWVTHPFAVWERPEDDAVAIAWARRFRREIAAHASGGVYLNFIGNEGQDRVKAAYGEAKYARLAQIKAEYDPANVFRGNQNIIPAWR
jgi:FAD/FMN-containing dehydrogenase